MFKKLKSENKGLPLLTVEISDHQSTMNTINGRKRIKVVCTKVNPIHVHLCRHRTLRHILQRCNSELKRHTFDEHNLMEFLKGKVINYNNMISK